MSIRSKQGPTFIEEACGCRVDHGIPYRCEKHRFAMSARKRIGFCHLCDHPHHFFGTCEANAAARADDNAPKPEPPAADVPAPSVASGTDSWTARRLMLEEASRALMVPAEPLPSPPPAEKDSDENPAITFDLIGSLQWLERYDPHPHIRRVSQLALAELARLQQAQAETQKENDQFREWLRIREEQLADAAKLIERAEKLAQSPAPAAAPDQEPSR